MPSPPREVILSGGSARIRNGKGGEDFVEMAGDMESCYQRQLDQENCPGHTAVDE